MSSQPYLVITGAGLVGGALAQEAANHGWRVRILHRNTEHDHDTIAPDVVIDDNGIEHGSWNPDAHQCHPAMVEEATAVVTLNGAPIAPHPWTAARKKLLIASRMDSASTMAHTLCDLPASTRPGIFLSASASGYYGSRGDDILTEHTGPGTGFLADLCVHWEQTTRRVISHDVRLINSRTGLVLDAHGGLGAMLTALYQFRMGAQLGDGKQWQPFIALQDAVNALLWALTHDDIDGPINLCGPEPLQAGDLHTFLTTRLGGVHRMALPAPLLRLGGAMTKELLLASQRMVPQALTDSGFTFTYPDALSAWDGAVMHHDS